MRKLSVVVFVFVALLTAACSPGEETTDTSTTSTSVPATTTTSTVETTTTSAPATTTTVAPSTTTSTEVSTTSTSVAESTTTTSGSTATVELTNQGIYAGDEWIQFGYDDDDAVAAVEAVLGPPSADSGWLDSLSEGWEQFGVCPQPNVRGVSWGSGGDISLQLLFTDADTDFWSGGVEHFFTYYYSDSSEPHDLTTPEGLGVGSTLGDLQATYDPADIVIDEAFFDPAVGFWSYRLATWTGLWGYATGQADTDTITSINGGQGCGE